MTYTLLALFLINGSSFVEYRHLSLQACAARAAMARQAIPPSLTAKIGEVRFMCIEEPRNG